MKKIIILFMFALSSCAIIYTNSSLKYKSAESWKKMSPQKMETILSNGVDLNQKDQNGMHPLKMACKYNNDVNLIKMLIDNGADVKQCNLYDFILKYKSEDKVELIKNVNKLLRFGVSPSSLSVDELLSLQPLEFYEIINMFATYKAFPSDTYFRDLIILNPITYTKSLAYIKNKGGTLPDKCRIALWRLGSPYMAKEKASLSWGKLVTEVKNNKCSNGVLGINKKQVIAKYGAPDKVYKIDAHTEVLTYSRETRSNIPISTVTSTSADTYYNSYNATTYATNYTMSRGGYTNVNRQDTQIFIEYGILTNIATKDKVVTY